MEKPQSHLYQLFILSLSIGVLLLLLIRTITHFDQQTLLIFAYADTVICFLFFIDFIILLIRAENKFKYLFTWGWLDLLSSIPSIDLLRWGRMARIMRLIRLMRGIKAFKIITMILKEKRAESVILFVILTSILLMVISSIAILQFEADANGTIKSAGDAVWWSLVTITTVGYGDVYPVTQEGKVIASIIMIAGISLFGTLSGFITSWFLEPAGKKNDDDFVFIKEELKALKEQLQQIQMKQI